MFAQLSREIIACRRCTRLRKYAKTVVKDMPARFTDGNFWGKPVPGFGDLNGRLLIIGLAPARTGALRTGRIFTGDLSSAFLVAALHSAGFANQARSESVDDGLVYRDCYVTAAVKCAPPADKPEPAEFANCSSYLDREVVLMVNLRSVLALGSSACRAYLTHLSRKGVRTRGLRFAHGSTYPFPGMPTLYTSYHPSPRNTNTGKLTPVMLDAVLARIKHDFSM